MNRELRNQNSEVTLDLEKWKGAVTARCRPFRLLKF
jgi:hypothetical protein